MLGKLLFYLLWPLVWIYAPLTRRVRVVILAKNEVLVVKNWFGSGYWQLPGGGIKMGESVVAAAQRELDEELSIVGLNLKELHDDPILIKQSGLLMRYHFVLLKSKKPLNIKASRFITAAEWQNTTKMVSAAQEVIKGLDLVSQQR